MAFDTINDQVQVALYSAHFVCSGADCAAAEANHGYREAKPIALASAIDDDDDKANRFR